MRRGEEGVRRGAGNVMDLRGDGKALVLPRQQLDSVTPRWRLRVVHGRRWQLVHEGVDDGLHLSEQLLVSGEVDDKAILGEQGVTHALELGEQRRPVVTRLGEHLRGGWKSERW